MKDTIRIGCATGWSRDQFYPGRDLLSRGSLDYLFFETMSELTMSAAQIARAESPELPGYDPYLMRRIAPMLAESLQNGTRLVSNMGWLDPQQAALDLANEAKTQGLGGFTIAAVTGGDLLDRLEELEIVSNETGQRMADLGDKVVSAEAYLGAAEIAEALRQGAHVVLTPRVTDASLVLGPLIAEFGWSFEDWNRLGWGVALGHLIECGGQITGGYFADPGYKDVADLANLGYPIAEIGEHSAVITKLEGTGGLVSTETCKEQMLYEVNDPFNYMNPDVVCDLGGLHFSQEGPDRVRVTGGRGKPAPTHLKVLIGVREGYMAEEMMVFAGPGAFARAELAREILTERLERAKFQAEEIRYDYVGLGAVHREATPEPFPELHEYVLRVAVRTESREEATKLQLEVDPMAVSGPAATGKWGSLGARVRPIVGLHSAYVDRAAVPAGLTYRQA
jgi:hypothetical protein